MSVQTWLLVALLLPTVALAWDAPPIALPADRSRPLVAATAAELQRLRDAWRANHRIIVGYLAAADRAIASPPTFPPRGGQHNQWYQCEKCQVALTTVDDTHHKCKKCGQIYSGEPFDDVIFARRHSRNLANARSAAWAYAITSDRKYADYTCAVLLGYARRYSQYPFHASNRKRDPYALLSGGRLAEQTLNEASFMSRTIAPAYDLIHDALRKEDRQTIRDGLITPMLNNIGKYRAGKSNWQTWHNAAMLLGGAAIEDETWVRRAILDNGNGFADQMQVSVTPEGMWYENSWGYHFYTISAMIEIVEGARRLGIDLWSHPRLKAMFTLPINYAMADGSLPRFGDDVNSKVAHASHRLEYAYHVYRDESMLGYLPRGESFTTLMFGRDVQPRDSAPPTRSVVFEGAGHAILRTAGEAKLSAAMTFGPYGGYHGHLDKLSFVFFGRGRELGVDPGRAASQAYRLPVHKRWYKPTISHNAVLVDGAAQRPAAGKLEFFAADDRYAAVAASCDGAFRGVKQTRMLVMTASYLLVVDKIESDNPHTFSWLYHNRGGEVNCEQAGKATAPRRNEPPGFEYIGNRRQGKTDQPVRARFVDDKVTTHLLMSGGAPTLVMTGDGPGASVTDRVPLVMISRKGKAVRFTAVLEPVRAGDKPSVSDVRVTEQAGELKVFVQRGDAGDNITWSADQTIELR